jgi:hypothetical protein
MFVCRRCSKQGDPEDLHSNTRAQGNKEVKTVVLLDVVPSSPVVICGRFGIPICLYV